MTCLKKCITLTVNGIDQQAAYEVTVKHLDCEGWQPVQQEKGNFSCFFFTMFDTVKYK